MNSNFSLVLVAARWGSIVLMVIVLMLMTYILCLRAVLLSRERRYRALAARWTPILLDGGERSPRPLPGVLPWDRYPMLVLWNTLREGRQQDAALCDWMACVAAQTGVDRLARRLVRSRSVRKRLLAIVALGHLGDRVEWRRLWQIARSGHPLLSLAASQSLARIDPAIATGMIVPLIVRHEHWSTGKVATVLEELGPDRISEPLERAVLQAPESDRPRLIAFLAVCQHSAALGAVRQLLRDPHADEVITPCLEVIRKFADRQDLPLVYRYLTHARWHVRAVAAGCIGGIGRQADQERLIPLLADRQWWVRYRAAQAIVCLSPEDDQRLHDIQGKLSDRYARDILTQAIAERTRPGHSASDLSPTARIRMGAGR
jgi:hypothetical protein